MFYTPKLNLKQEREQPRLNILLVCELRKKTQFKAVSPLFIYFFHFFVGNTFHQTRYKPETITATTTVAKHKHEKSQNWEGGGEGGVECVESIHLYNLKKGNEDYTRKISKPR